MADVRCAHIKISTNEIVEFQWHKGACPPDLPNVDVKWLPAPRTPAPAYDPALQVLEGPFHTIEETQVTESWNVRDKTQEEIDAEVEEGLDRQRLHNFYWAGWDMINTLKALQANAGLTDEQLATLKQQHGLTEAQYRDYLKQAKGMALGARGTPVQGEPKR